MIPELLLPSPALHWTDGHVLGNGDVGAVVWGTPERVCIGLSKHDVNDLRGPEPHGARPKATYPEIRDRFMRGEREAVKDLQQTNPGTRAGQQQIACGRLALELLRNTQPRAFRQSLSLEKAEATVCVSPTAAGGSFGMRYEPITLRVRVLAGRNLVVAELASDSAQHIRWSFDRSPDSERPAPVYGTEGTPFMRHGLPCGTEYAVAIHTMGGTCTAQATEHGLLGTLQFGGAHGPATLVLGMASDRDAGRGNVVSLATKLAIDLPKGGLETLVRSHHEWWRRFWAASGIEYGDGDLQRLWYAGLYALGASTRPHTSPPNLQGIWVQDEISPWHTDFHFNTNVQECQWAACSTNHPELQQALVRVLTKDWRDELDRTGQEVYGVAAPAPYLGVDWRGRAISTWGYLELAVPAWTAQHLWEQFLYTLDEELLRATVYPYLRDCARLYLSLLVADETGQLNIELSHSPEQIWFDEEGKRYFTYGRNPSIDLSCIRTLLEPVVESACLLGNGDPFAETCRDALARLAPLPQEDGVLIDYETGFFHDGDRPGHLRHCHRHPSRLMPIFPGRQIGLHSDLESLDLGRRSFAEFRSYGEAGFTGWSYAYQACIAARLGLGDDAELCLRTLVRGYLLKGLLTSHNSIVPGVGNYDQYSGSPLFQLDALLGATAAITEMLVQRPADGVIRVFPAVPADRPASFTTLRVPGAVLVSAAKTAQTVAWIEVRAELAGELALASPWPQGTAVQLPPGTQLSTDGQTFCWSAVPGVTYRFALSA